MLCQYTRDTEHYHRYNRSKLSWTGDKIGKWFRYTPLIFTPGFLLEVPVFVLLIDVELNFEFGLLDERIELLSLFVAFTCQFVLSLPCSSVKQQGRYSLKSCTKRVPLDRSQLGVAFPNNTVGVKSFGVN